MSDVEKIVDLLRPQPGEVYAAVSEDARRFIAELIRTKPNNLLQLYMRILEPANTACSMPYGLTAFLSHEALETVAALLNAKASSKDAELHEGLAQEIWHQDPDLIDECYVEGLYAFRLQEVDGPNPRPSSWHLSFDPLPEHRGRLLPGIDHPTWMLPRSDRLSPVEIGGPGANTCPGCGMRHDHLMTLNDPPPDLGVSLHKLTLECCAECWWDRAFFQHSETGEPLRLEPIDTSFVDGHAPVDPSPLIRIKAGLSPTPPRHQRQPWDHRENLYRLGGRSTWVQNIDNPISPVTNEPMQFLAQLDSSLSLENGDELLWASGAVHYVFWDDANRISCHFNQWT